MIFIQFYLILMREPEYLPEKNCFAFPSLLLSQFMSSSGMAIFFFFNFVNYMFTFIYAYKSIGQDGE